LIFLRIRAILLARNQTFIHVSPRNIHKLPVFEGDVSVEHETIQVHMLGDFSIRWGGMEISDRDNRSRKAWLLLAYLIYCRERTAAPDDLSRLLWAHEEGSTNPQNALKTMLHRVRAMLNGLGSDAGATLIVRKKGCYAWNTEVPLSCDVDQFESLCRSAEQLEDGDARLDQYLEALNLYQGNFLNKLSAEAWVIPIAAYYHNLYVNTVLSALPLLEAQQRSADAVALCRKAVTLEPYNEVIYQHLMENLLALGDQRSVLDVYDYMSRLLLDHLGVTPSQPLRNLQREAMRIVNDRAVSFDTVISQLQEPKSDTSTALLCEYDFFKVIFRAQARALIRTGDVVHIGLISVVGENGRILSRRSQERVMENLENVVLASLRKGDVVSRCSVSQFILLLPQANYENSCVVCQRIVKAFYRQFPHSPAKLIYAVQPLEPSN
jgi:DNA-binding SARP family transcriptional activator